MSRSLDLYTKALKLIENKDEGLFKQLKSILLGNKGLINEQIKSMLRSILTAYYLNIKPTHPEKGYYEELLVLMGPPTDHLFVGYLRDNVFNIYIINYLCTGQLGKCLKFINENNKYLKPCIRAEVINFGLSKYFLFSKNFRQSLEYALKCKKLKWWYYINASSTAIICYYELGMDKQALILIEKTKKFLNRHKIIPNEEIVMNNNFIYAVENLIKIRLNMNSRIYIKLREITKISIYHSKWIAEKLNNLNMQ